MFPARNASGPPEVEAAPEPQPSRPRRQIVGRDKLAVSACGAADPPFTRREPTGLKHSDFEIRVCFAFRISHFGFFNRWIFRIDSNARFKRGRRRGSDRAEEEAQRALTEKELQRLHSQARLELCEHIERCLRQLADRFPGFRFETIVDHRGWGARSRRDDLRLPPRRNRGRAASAAWKCSCRPPRPP